MPLPHRIVFLETFRPASRVSVPQLALHLRKASSIPSARAIPLRPLSPRFYSSHPVSSAPVTSSPPPRSFLLRALSITTLGLVLTSAAFLMAASPAIPSLSQLASPPSSADTLGLYTPPDPLSASIDHHITTHPLAVSLRQNPSFTESRPHMRIPAPMRAHNLTGGTLHGPGRIVVPPLAFIEDDGKSMVCFFYLGEDLCGHPGIIHGGLLATILDEGMARCCFPALPNKVGMTANLTMNYRKPCPSERYVVLRAWTKNVEGRKAWVEGRVESLEAEEEATVFVEAEALFIEPRQAATMARLYPAATA